MRMWCAKPVGATHHGRLHNAQATEWREGLDRPGRGHPDLAGIYQPGNMTIDARKKKKKIINIILSHHIRIDHQISLSRFRSSANASNSSVFNAGTMRVRNNNIYFVSFCGSLGVLMFTVLMFTVLMFTVFTVWMFTVLLF